MNRHFSTNIVRGFGFRAETAVQEYATAYANKPSSQNKERPLSNNMRKQMQNTRNRASKKEAVQPYREEAAVQQYAKTDSEYTQQSF